MSARRLTGATTGVVTLLTACVSLAPGAEKVQITRTASDVAKCSAVGNVRVPIESQGQLDIADADTRFRNEVIGLGGNTAFVTSSSLGIPVQGVAYRCP